ncbi:hypothetical protein DERF_004575 [Dermatophagoides farinae]|uniref:Uncharacterized protein n=1 Tax=Dermatophagoides farinae TaxID=6954 RepID=A0A922I277_DERFA|nr:hypothetical protein DERF_004575 [Dermatophagoides farinae]
MINNNSEKEEEVKLKTADFIYCPFTDDDDDDQRSTVKQQQQQPVAAAAAAVNHSIRWIHSGLLGFFSGV